MTTPSSDAGFAMDVAGMREAVRQYTDALNQLIAIRRDATQLGDLAHPADQVSIDAAQALINTGVGEKDSFAMALDQGIERLQRHIEQIQAAIEGYQADDQQAGSGLSPAT